MICLGTQKAHKHKHICRDRDIPSLLGFMIKGSIFAYVLFWGPIYVSLCRFMITPGAGGGGLRTAASTIILRHLWARAVFAVVLPVSRAQGLFSP